MKDLPPADAPIDRDAGAPENLRSLVEHAPVGVYRADAEGRWLYANPACLAILGLTLPQALGHGWLQAVHPADREALEQVYLTEARGPGLRHELRVCLPDGRVRTVMMRLWTLLDPVGAAGFLGSVGDVTASAQTERRLRSVVQLLDRTGQIAGVGGWDIDLRTRRVRWTAQTCRIHDLPLDWQPTIEDGIQYYAPEAQPVIAGLVDRAIRFGEPFDVELPFITAAGRRLHVRAVGDVEQADGQPVRLFGAFQDITAQRAAAIEIRQSRERLRQLYDETPALMASVDASGTVLSASRLLLERLGWDRAAVLGASAASLLAGDLAERRTAIAQVRSGLLDPQGIRAQPLRLLRRDGGSVNTLMSAVVERSPAGHPVRVLAVFEDLSESIQRLAELARERALRAEVERQAHELARLADERREMLDVLAHEVRQPLNNASAALQSASAMSGSQQGDALQRLARAQGVIGQVVAQIDNTLAAAELLVGRQPLQRSDIDIDTLLALVTADFAASERERLAVERLTPTRTASMDLSLMRLALRNLLANALRHAPPGSMVTIRVSDSDEPLALLLDVVDRGPGVPVELGERVFERGRRGPGSRGQGLGLYIARRALELHGGTATLLTHTPGETVFRLVVAQDERDTDYSTSAALNT